MCSYKTLWLNENGAILQCRDCNCFQISFGTTMLTLDEKNFSIFTEMINYRFGTLRPLGMEKKYIVLPTPCPAINVILSEKELGNIEQYVTACR